jgi:hypothetical protein
VLGFVDWRKVPVGNPEEEATSCEREIDLYQKSEKVQICHIQIASKDEEVFEYAIEQVRYHVARTYAEYQDAALRVIKSSANSQQKLLTPNDIWSNMLIP